MGPTRSSPSQPADDGGRLVDAQPHGSVGRPRSQRRYSAGDEVDDIALLLEGSAQRRVIGMFSSERDIAFGIRRGDTRRYVLAVLERESLTIRLDRDPYGAEDELGSIVIATRMPSPRVDTPALAIFFEDGRVARAAAGYAGWLSMQPEAQVENCRPES